MSNSRVTLWTANITPARGSDPGCDPGNNHLQPHISSRGPDKPVYSVFSVPI